MFPSACPPQESIQRKRRVRQLPRHTCRGCEAHPARFRYRGEVRADRDHELCFRCFRTVIDQLRAKALAEAA
jgi:hypothetical protein